MEFSIKNNYDLMEYMDRVRELSDFTFSFFGQYCITINGVMMPTFLEKANHGFECNQIKGWTPCLEVKYALGQYVKKILFRDMKTLIEKVRLHRLETVTKSDWDVLFHIEMALMALEMNQRGCHVKELYTYRPMDEDKQKYTLKEKYFEKLLLDLGLAEKKETNLLFLTDLGSRILNKTKKAKELIIKLKVQEEEKWSGGQPAIPGRGICLKCGQPAQDSFGQYCFTCRKKIAKQENMTD